MDSAQMRLGSFDSGSNPISAESITLFGVLLCACIVIGHLLQDKQWISESVTAEFLGLFTGAIILLVTGGKSSRILVFNEELFFTCVLPAIIFNAGFQVKKKQFFRNFTTISLFGVLGTVISFCVISFGAKALFGLLGLGNLELRDYLALGAIFSATDSVCTLQVLNQDETPLLYSLVFGEGVVNDATSVVLFNAIQKFDLSGFNSGMVLKFVGNFVSLFVTSTLLGVGVGLLSAYIIKKFYFARHSTAREVALVVLMPYITYLVAQLFDLSGILTVFFCGIVMSHYTWHNITESSQVTTKHAFQTLSYIAETFIFLYLGMDALDIEKWKLVSNSPGKPVAASAVLLVLVLIGRAAFVFPLSYLSNFAKRSKRDELSIKKQVTIWWAGLMRGAVSMALAYNQFAKSGHTQQPGNATMITSTIIVVLFSTVVFGLLTKPLVKYLLPRPTQQPATVSSEPSSPKSMTLPLLSKQESEDGCLGRIKIRRSPSLSLLLSSPTHTVHDYWKKFDVTYMHPVFGGRGFDRAPREDSEGSKKLATSISI